MLKILLAIGIVWLFMGAVGALMVDRQRPITLSDVALGPITLGHEMWSVVIG